MAIKQPVSTGLTTGQPAVDELIGGIHVGDNVVWEIVGPLEEAIIRSFVTAPSSAGLVYVTFVEPASEVLRRYQEAWGKREVLLIDCFATTPAAGSPPTERGRHRIHVVDDPLQPAHLLDALEEAEGSVGEGSSYVFDNLTAIQDAWGPDEALDLFLQHCPRLYELRTVAYWFLRKEAHDASFVARLRRTTQVVLETTSSDGTHLLRVAKAAGRNEAVGRVAEFVLSEDGALEVSAHVQEPPPSGADLKSRRLVKGLSQAELARRLGITPSALSQAEAGVRGLSEETLQSAYAILGTQVEQPSLPYTLARRRARRSRELLSGIREEPVLEDSSRMSVSILEFAAGASGRRPPFATKQKEVVVLISGVLELHIGPATEVLQAGDAIVIRDEPVTSWSNPGSSPARALWSILPPASRDA